MVDRAGTSGDAQPLASAEVRCPLSENSCVPLRSNALRLDGTECPVSAMSAYETGASTTVLSPPWRRIDGFALFDGLD
jgi:hypothetical protein